jgi:hypothetical protein
VPFLRWGRRDSLWRQLLLSAAFETARRAEPLVEAARAALSWIPVVWDRIGTDALLEAPKYVERERRQMVDAGLDPFDAETAQEILSDALEAKLAR